MDGSAHSGAQISGSRAAGLVAACLEISVGNIHFSRPGSPALRQKAACKSQSSVHDGKAQHGDLAACDVYLYSLEIISAVFFQSWNSSVLLQISEFPAQLYSVRDQVQNVNFF